MDALSVELFAELSSLLDLDYLLNELVHVNFRLLLGILLGNKSDIFEGVKLLVSFKLLEERDEVLHWQHAPRAVSILFESDQLVVDVPFIRVERLQDFLNYHIRVHVGLLLLGKGFEELFNFTGRDQLSTLSVNSIENRLDCSVCHCWDVQRVDSQFKVVFIQSVWIVGDRVIRKPLVDSRVAFPDGSLNSLQLITIVLEDYIVVGFLNTAEAVLESHEINHLKRVLVEARRLTQELLLQLSGFKWTDQRAKGSVIEAGFKVRQSHGLCVVEHLFGFVKDLAQQFVVIIQEAFYLLQDTRDFRRNC